MRPGQSCSLLRPVATAVLLASCASQLTPTGDSGGVDSGVPVNRRPAAKDAAADVGSTGPDAQTRHPVPPSHASSGCQSGARTCSGIVPAVCVDGLWQDDARCPATAPVCRYGLCVSRQAVSAGGTHTCAVLDSGRVKCWGDNRDGELGLGDTTNRGDQPGQMGMALPYVDLGSDGKSLAVAACFGWTCALLDTGQVKCWGLNDQGQLGLGDTRSRGGHPGEMGDALPTVDLGQGKTARAISCSGGVGGMTCALLDDSTLKCWGDNEFGSLGLGDVENRGDRPGQMGDALPAVELGTGRRAVSIATGVQASCALLENGQVKCWGTNGFGALGVGDVQQLGDEPGEMADMLPAVDLGTNRTAVSIASGLDNVCAILDNDDLKCWGGNQDGELGLGDDVFRGAKPSDMGDNLPPIDLGTAEKAVATSVGSSTLCAVLRSGRAKCWVYVDAGVLSKQINWMTVPLGDMPGEMGDALPSLSLGTNLQVLALSVNGYPDHACALLTGGIIKCWGDNCFGQLGHGDSYPDGYGTGAGDNLPRVPLE
jgi:alpha-tubulin suppressor-like RCC1 family protein